MDGWLKASTATTIQVGPYLSTNGFTAKQNLKVSVGVFQISKNAGAYANKTATTMGASAPGGWYIVNLSSADVNTVGNLQYKSVISSYPPVFGSYIVLPKIIYSNMFAGNYWQANTIQIEGVDATNQLSTAVQQASIAAKVKSLGVNYVSSVGLVKKMNANVVSAGVIANSAITADKIGNDAITADKINSAAIDAATFAAGAIDANAIATGAITNAKIAANALSAGKVVSGTITNAKFAAGALSAGTLVTGTITNSKFATGALSGGTLAANAKSSIGTAVWLTATRQLTGTQTFNLTGNITGNVTGSVGSVVTFKPSAISAPVIATGALTNAKFAAGALSAGTLVTGTITNAKFAANAISAGVVTDNVITSIADGVWNEALAGHSTAGTAGRRLLFTGIPKSTPFSNITFLMVDATDDITPKTGLSPTATVSRDGGAFGAASGTVAEIASGYYQFDASATDMSGGLVTFKFAATGANDTTISIRTVS